MRRILVIISLLLMLCLLTALCVGAQPETAVTGDYDGNGQVSDGDALYLLRYTLFPERYPVYQSPDVDADGTADDGDALYLLRYTLFSDRYPLFPGLDHVHNHTAQVTSPTCQTKGYTTYVCACGDAYINGWTDPSDDHSWETMTVADAAPKCADLGNYGLQKYSRMTDINITICTNCGYADYESACSIYTAAQETDIMVSLTQPVRREFMYQNALDAGDTPEDANRYCEDYKHVADTISINHAKRRAKEIVSDYSHNGKPGDYRENINRGAQNIQTDFENWINSSGHYTNIIHSNYPYVGYARHVVGDNDTETITVYSVLLMGYFSR